MKNEFRLTRGHRPTVETVETCHQNSTRFFPTPSSSPLSLATISGPLCLPLSHLHLLNRSTLPHVHQSRGQWMNWFLYTARTFMICIRRDLDRHGTPIHPSIPEKLILMSDVTEESLDERVSIRFSFKSFRLEDNLKKGGRGMWFILF